MTGSPVESTERAREEPSRHLLQLGDLPIHYLEWGDPANRPLVLLHGGGQNAFTWLRIGQRFRDRYHVVAPDLRGHGDSGWAAEGDYSVEAMQEDVRLLAVKLGFSRFVLAGMSLGGMVGLSYAGIYGDTLRGLVVVDFAPDLKQTGTEKMVGFLRGRDSFASLDDAIAYVRTFNPKRSEEGLRRSLPRNLRTLPDGRLAWKWDPAFIRRPEDGGGPGRRHGPGKMTIHLWEMAARIPCPALVVRGWESDLLGQEAAERLARTLPHGRYVSIEGAGHAVQNDNPHGLASEMVTFLEEICY
jgi:pimeloyl-ACP methyl ester carboxylesterase